MFNQKFHSDRRFLPVEINQWLCRENRIVIQSINYSARFEKQDRSRAREAVDLPLSALAQPTPALISPHLWPPNSRNLKPVDCKISIIVQQRVCKSKPALRRRTYAASAAFAAWRIKQRGIDSAIDKWRCVFEFVWRQDVHILNKCCNYDVIQINFKNMFI